MKFRICAGSSLVLVMKDKSRVHASPGFEFDSDDLEDSNICKGLERKGFIKRPGAPEPEREIETMSVDEETGVSIEKKKVTPQEPGQGGVLSTEKAAALTPDAAGVRMAAELQRRREAGEKLWTYTKEELGEVDLERLVVVAQSIDPTAKIDTQEEAEAFFGQDLPSSSSDGRSIEELIASSDASKAE